MHIYIRLSNKAKSIKVYKMFINITIIKEPSGTLPAKKRMF